MKYHEGSYGFHAHQLDWISLQPWGGRLGGVGFPPLSLKTYVNSTFVPPRSTNPQKREELALASDCCVANMEPKNNLRMYIYDHEIIESRNPPRFLKFELEHVKLTRIWPAWCPWTSPNTLRWWLLLDRCRKSKHLLVLQCNICNTTPDFQQTCLRSAVQWTRMHLPSASATKKPIRPCTEPSFKPNKCFYLEKEVLKSRLFFSKFRRHQFNYSFALI